MRRIYLKMGLAAALLLVAVVAFANKPRGGNGHGEDAAGCSGGCGHGEAKGGRGAWFREHMQRKFEAAMTAGKVTPEQHKTLIALSDEVFEAGHDGMQNHRAAMQEALQLFSGAKIDPAAVAAIKNRKAAQQQLMADAMSSALVRAHAVLQPAQRKALVAYAQDNRPDREPGMREKFMHHFMDKRIDNALDAVAATEPQRKLAAAIGQRVTAQFRTQRSAHNDLMDKLLALFVGDRLDNQALESLKATQAALHTTMADAVAAGIIEFHAALTPKQRQLLVDHVKSHHHDRGER